MLSKVQAEKGLLTPDTPGGHRAVGRGEPFQQRIKLPQDRQRWPQTPLGWKTEAKRGLQSSGCWMLPSRSGGRSCLPQVLCLWVAKHLGSGSPLFLQ